VGDVCHRFFSAEGELVASQIDPRVVGIAPDVYRAIPRRVGVAGGLRKRKAIHAAIKGGWVNVVVTDLATARDLLAA
jgi:DNA-binding transcriptional regulator LsrR (DeoR family)